jgi:hypothetical protein
LILIRRDHSMNGIQRRAGAVFVAVSTLAPLSAAASEVKSTAIQNEIRPTVTAVTKKVRQYSATLPEKTRHNVEGAGVLLTMAGILFGGGSLYKKLLKG